MFKNLLNSLTYNNDESNMIIASHSNTEKSEAKLDTGYVSHRGSWHNLGTMSSLGGRMWWENEFRRLKLE